MRPVICMVTDRRRLGTDRMDDLVGRVQAAARAGVHLIQVREADLDDRALAGLVARCLDAVRGTSARLLVNDRLDIALATGAHGVHLRADSIPPARVRSLVTGAFIVGRSIHSADEAARAAQEGAVTYLTFGTVFESSSKPGRPPAGLAGLRQAVAAAATVPVLAIGGIAPERLDGVAGAGACGFAAIGLFADVPAESIRGMVDAAASAFDTRPAGS